QGGQLAGRVGLGHQVTDARVVPTGGVEAAGLETSRRTATERARVGTLAVGSVLAVDPLAGGVARGAFGPSGEAGRVGVAPLEAAERDAAGRGLTGEGVVVLRVDDGDGQGDQR